MINAKLIIKLLLLAVVMLWCFHVSSTGAITRMKDKSSEEKTAIRLSKLAQEGLPNAQQRVHRVGLVRLCVTNWGFFGSQTRDLKESKGGCFNPNPNEEVKAPSCEYPAGSGIEYLFQGGLWIGAMVEDQPYTTVGCDGWFWIYEMWPDAGEKGAIKERSVRRNTSCYSPDAVSEQDIIAVYTDTSADIPLSPEDKDSWDIRKHFPLGLQVTQQSYSWSYEYAEDFVLIDLFVKNIGVKKIKDMYMGLYIDADVMHIDENPYGPNGAQDDICGFKPIVTHPKPGGDCSDTINLAWIADNDGHGIKGETIFGLKSPIAVSGTRVVRAPKPGLKYSFNWWISNQNNNLLDWGPWKQENQNIWANENCYEPGKNNFPNNVLGTPGGDCSKYFIMSNQEFDYDQIFACDWPTDHPEERWLPSSSMCSDLADGYDTRYLLSFGPFDQIAPGESLVITIGYIVGADFHVDPLNGARLSKGDPKGYYANLNFTDFETNAIWAAKVYDNPDKEHPCGDGKPDFKGPPPPPSPTLSFETTKGKVKVKWNGKITEGSRDSFNGRKDFEGYRVYMSRTGTVEDYALLGSYDRVDYKIYQLNRVKDPREWEWKAASVSLDSLKSWLNKNNLGYNMEIGNDPTVFTENSCFIIRPTLMQPFYIRLSDSIDANGNVVVYDSIKLDKGDSLYFEAQDWNVGFGGIISDTAYRRMVDANGGPNSQTEDRYWDYEHEVEVFPSQPIYFAVTAFDVGDPQTGLKPLEASRLVNATLVYPIDNLEKVKTEDLKVMVYPNPYRIDGNYSGDKYEAGGTYGKRIRFVNLPAYCTIRIYTLDGDLVRTIDHKKDPGVLDATYDEWDLISRNTQAVVSGIYLFSVEDKDTGKNQVGKFVIIK